MTNTDIAQTARGLSEPRRKAIHLARCVAPQTYEIGRSQSQALTRLGLAWRDAGRIYLSETGLAVRKWMMENSDV